MSDPKSPSKKYDLSAFKTGHLGQLKPNSAGRKPQPPETRRSAAVTVHFTPGELQQIKRKAGLAPTSTFLRAAVLNALEIAPNDDPLGSEFLW